MDAILEAYAEDFPKKLKFARKGAGKESERVEVISTQWVNRLIGNARDELRKKFSFNLPEKYHRTRPSAQQTPATNQSVRQAARQMPYRPAPKR